MNQVVDSELPPARVRFLLKSRHMLIGLLVTAIVLVHLLASAAHYVAGGERPPDPTSTLLLGLALADTCLAGLYLVLGRNSANNRFFVALAMTLGGGLTGGYAVGFDNSGDEWAMLRLWCGIALFHALLTAVPVVYLLARGLRVVHPDDPPLAPTMRKPSFTLWGIMSVVTCTAVLLAIARLATFPTNDVQEVLALGGISACVTYIAAATMLSDRSLQTSLAWIGGAAIIAAMAIPRFVHALDGWESSMIMLSQASLLAGVMFVLRTAGYRTRWPEYVVPSENHFPAVPSAPRGDPSTGTTAPNRP